MKIKVNNIPSYAWKYKYIVFRIVDGGKWFWGAFDDADKALEASLSVDGAMIPIEEVHHDTV